MTYNLLLLTDSYKASHAYQYPPGTEYVYSYIESRGGKFDRTLFFGLQMFTKEYLLKRITKGMVDKAEKFWKAHGEPFYREGWDYIVNVHKGRLPIEIKAAPEGVVIPTRNVLVTIVNTDPKCWWLTSFLETAILRAVWYPTTVATLSYHCKKIIMEAIEKSSDDYAQIAFKLHDFGARGVSSHESAMLGGCAHIVNFMGSDTVEGIMAAMEYYDANVSAFSIPAAEHSTITSWGRENETDAYRNMLKHFAKPGSIVAIVSDSYDLMNAVNHIFGETLRNDIVNSGATVVIRPDSGDPLTVPVDVIKALAEKFGYTTNSKGYKVLPSYIRVIQGDGITIDSLPIIIDNLLAAGFAIDNLAFGMGGGLLQHVNRDTQMFAMKCSAAFINGKWVDVFKDPITDKKKVSKKGRFVLTRERSLKYETLPLHESFDWADMLHTVYLNGSLKKTYTFDEVRHNANLPELA